MLVLHAGIKIGGVEPGSGAYLVLLVAVGAFVLAGAMRLARFNMSSQTPSDGWFLGLPITAAGGGLISTGIILMVKYDAVADVLPLHAYLPVLLFVLALGMVSTLRFPKITRRDSKFINAFQGFNFIASYYCGITRSYPEFLFFMAVFLLIVGIIAGRLSKAAPGTA
jgi:CDP-diacylglycerol--serine O-phosphatidyltransferase